jgi:hypothetical protein
MEEPDFLDKTMAGDQQWFFQYGRKTTHHSFQWESPKYLSFLHEPRSTRKVF